MRNCSRRSRKLVTNEDDDPDAVESVTSKRPYSRKSLQCRLCLRILSKEELPEIFSTGSGVQKFIRSAVSVEVTRKDRSIRICHCCLNLVHIINDFRDICERTEHLLKQEVEIDGGSFWNLEVDQKTFETCRSLVEDCRREIDQICSEESPVKCEEQPEEPVKEPDQIELKLENAIFEETAILVKSELNPDLNVENVEFEILDCSQEGENEEEKAIQTETQEEESIQQQQPEEEPVKVRRKRRGRPPLPEELRKTRKRRPDEPRRKPGPKANKNKLPAQSVCEICGKLVNRENEERHRNDHLGHRPYACSIEGCDHRFSSKAGLHGHMARHADRNNVYDCDICGAKIKTKSSLHRHRKMHTVAEKPHACSICGKRFWRRSYLNHHATVHTGIAKFPCEYCGFVFKNKYWRSFHVKQKHVAKGEQPKFEAHEELDENGELVLPEGLVEEGEEEEEGEVEYMEVVCE